MHIYYTTKGLRGNSYHSDIINTDLFAFFQGKRSRTIPSAENLRVANAFPKCDIDMGEDTDSEYVCEKGTFYIPKSICMGEVVNAGWAVDYYFVVLCGDAVELRYVRWDCPWYETVGRDTEVTDPAVIAKMERTLAMLLDANRPRIPAPVSISRPALLTFFTLLGVADAEALADKIHAAATTPAQCAELCEEFDMEEAYTGWHVTLMRLALRDRKRLDWVDWKEAPEEVFASLCCLLPPGAKEHLPPCDDEDAYPEEVLRACSPVLHDRYGLTILLWDTGGDEYVFMVVPSDKVAEAFAAASELGMTLQRVRPGVDGGKRSGTPWRTIVRLPGLASPCGDEACRSAPPAKNTGQRRRGSVVRRRAHGDTAAARQLRSSATETWILGIGRGEKIPLTKKGFR